MDEQDRRSLLHWGEARRRDLPWRRTRDPWAILVSETMLQQTQVARVVPRFLEVMERFPTTAACAAAPAGDLLRLWSGLGYNGRAVRPARRGRRRRTGLRRALPPDDRRAAAPARRRAVHGAGDHGVRLRGRRGRRRHQRRPDLGPVVGPLAAARRGPGARRRGGAGGRGLGLEPVPARPRRHRLPGPRTAVRELPVGAVVRVVGGRMPGAGSRVGVGAHQPAAVALRGLRPPGPRSPRPRPWAGSGQRRPPGRDHGLARRRGPRGAGGGRRGGRRPRRPASRTASTGSPDRQVVVVAARRSWSWSSSWWRPPSSAARSSPAGRRRRRRWRWRRRWRRDDDVLVELCAQVRGQRHGPRGGQVDAVGPEPLPVAGAVGVPVGQVERRVVDRVEVQHQVVVGVQAAGREAARQDVGHVERDRSAR